MVIGAVAWGGGQGSVGMSLRDSVVDHLQRSQFFVDEADRSTDERRNNWYLLTAIYSAVAAFEIARTQYEELERCDRAAFLAQAKVSIRHFELLDVVRVHDFHRGAVGFSAGASFINGPIVGKRSSKPGTTVSIELHLSTGAIQMEGQNASMRANRLLHARGFEVLDPSTDTFVRIHSAIRAYISDLPQFIESQFPNGEG